jgi:hypothetical protein
MSKWEKGGRMDDPMMVISFIIAGEPIFDGHKVQNAGWAQNWSVREIIRRTRMGHFYIALPSKRNPVE